MFRLIAKLLRQYLFRDKLTIYEMLRYGVVGGLAACIEFSLYVFLVEVYAFWAYHFLFAHAISFFAANSFAFTLHKIWTFHARKHPLHKQYLRYIIVTLSLFFLGDALLYFFIGVVGWNKVLVKLILVITASGTSYLMNRLWTFNSRYVATA